MKFIENWAPLHPLLGLLARFAWAAPRSFNPEDPKDPKGLIRTFLMPPHQVHGALYLITWQGDVIESAVDLVFGIHRDPAYAIGYVNTLSEALQRNRPR